MIALAWIVLWLSPVVALMLFRSLTVPAALSITIVGAYLALPSGLGVNFPVLPYLDRDTLPIFAALFLTIAALSQPQQASWRMPQWIPTSPLIRLLLVMLFLGLFGTVMTNRDTLVYGPRVLPGLSLYDAFSWSLEWLVILTPFFLGRMVLSSQSAQTTLLKVIVVAALIYSLPVLWEVRMAPQLHGQIYGYVPFNFSQQVRGDGFRPVVFLGHGLLLSIFLTLSVIAAATLFRADTTSQRWKWGMSMLWLFAVMVLTKSLGALIITVLLVPAVLFLKTRTQLLFAFCIACSVLTYPILRAAHLVPVDKAMELATSIEPARAASLKTRLDNEEILLTHSAERPIFGWGGWGRQRVFTQWGKDITLTDGYWVIQMSGGGWVRYLAVFGLLCWPIITFFRRRHEPVDPVCIGLIFMLCAKLIDFIPNAGMMPLLLLIVGALVGRLERTVPADAPVRDSAEAGTPALSYSRYAHRGAPAAAEPDPPDAPAPAPKPYARPRPARGYRR